MALILNLETSTRMCSVALAQDGHSVAFRELGGEYTHAENLTLFIQDVFEQAGKQLNQLDAIAVSKGPGSYTGLRIGISTAKGLCYALQKPLLAVPTLESLLHVMRSGFEGLPGDLYCPMLDARRLEVYCAVYDSQNKMVEEVQAKIIDNDSFASLLEKGRLIMFGDGADKCKPFLLSPNAVFADGILPSARHMALLSELAWKEKRFEDVAYFEPFYLKEFYSGKGQ
ncbi:MAG TPA: tRNA (adenosine(37)-N6)-threonylcarbamoyltransferase complex dimerization subunit type 1 TsaB [Bacteroidia bacterium]|jgi:tRNA threonylcarbamoyladenosine biosynthesis protein TsaB|nr:tRNA (adenosine(37)-N6)-threonylcarbamoyltransferase complex dimerization subunit type 1 TsaB [Bacteroidia bacterium]